MWREIIVKVGSAGEDILKRAPVNTVQALGVVMKRKNAAVCQLPTRDIALLGQVCSSSKTRAQGWRMYLGCYIRNSRVSQKLGSITVLASL